MLPYTSSNLPGDSDGQPSSVSLFGLAPDGVYQAFPVTRETGALLPHRFTLTQPLIQWNKPSALKTPVPLNEQLGGLLSVALSFTSP